MPVLEIASRCLSAITGTTPDTEESLALWQKHFLCSGGVELQFLSYPSSELGFMAAASKPARCGLPWERIQEILLRCQVLRAAACALCEDSADLCEVSSLLLEENGDVRDFLRETMLSTWSRRELRQDRKDSRPHKRLVRSRKVTK